MSSYLVLLWLFMKNKKPAPYWLWYWGHDQNDVTRHSPKIKFTDFDKMKTFSAKHGAEHSWMKPNYWSNYEKIEE